jgi:hypothetical protein
MIQLSQRLLRGRINLRALGISEVFAVFVCRGGTVRSRILLAPWRICRREITLPYRFQVIVKLCDVCSLFQSVMVDPQLARNVAYNAICLLHKLVQGLHAEDIRLHRLCVVSDQHLVEYRSDVHRGVAVRDHFELLA